MKRRDFLKALGLAGAACCCTPFNAAAAGEQRTYSMRKLLKDFDGRAEARRDQYLPLVGADKIDALLDEMRDSYETLIPQIPFIGNHNFHLQWYIPNCEFLAEYLVLKGYGFTALECAQRRLEKNLSDLMAMPEETREMICNMQFGPLPEAQMRFRSALSQLGIYKAAHVMTFVKGDGTDFDWGLDYTKCANCMVYKAHDADDLLYMGVCSMDYVAGKAFKTGYKRTMQLATGDPICDLRWKKGVESVLPTF